MRWIEILNESVKKYEPMFSGIFSAFMGKDGHLSKSADSIRKHIASAEQILKKEDRIVWYLRWYRLYWCYMMLDTFNGRHIEEDDPQFAKLRKLSDRYLSELGITWHQWDEQWSAAKDLETWGHFANSGCQKVQAVNWDRQLPSQFVLELSALEKDWAEARSQELSHNGDEDVFLDFNDGWAWYDLNTEECDLESKAMGHCGNAGGERGDTILSLRRHIDGARYRPSLTFILDSEGNLGEMKGRANEKPKERYHPYIVALLHDPRIKGIKGGGYQPENNFSINDLPAEQKARLLDQKPALIGIEELWEIYSKGGKRDDELGARLKDRLERELTSFGFNFVEIRLGTQTVDGVIVVEKYQDVKEYFYTANSYTYELAEFFNKHLPLELDRKANLTSIKAENVSQAARKRLFPTMFRALLPLDFKYRASNISEYANGEMEVDLTREGYIEVNLPISHYIGIAHGEDASANLRYLGADLASVSEYDRESLSDAGLIEYADDAVQGAIYEYIDKFSQGKQADMSQELIDLIMSEFGNYADESFTEPDPRQRSFDF
jgi:hypothetical protein